MDNKKNPQHDDLQKKHALEQHEVSQVLDFMKQYGKLILIGILAATVAMLASKGLARKKANKMARAEELLITAQTAQQLEEVVSHYRSTPAAPVALLNLAKTHFNNGEFFLARAEYERFLKKHKKHELRPVADYGLACCTEADGDFDAAVTLFTNFIEAQDGHYLQPAASIARARSLAQANRPDEARVVLEDFLADNASGSWAGQAEAALQQLGQ